MDKKKPILDKKNSTIPVEEIQRQAHRKLKAKNKSPFWLGLGMFGLVGWSVVIPTLIGVAIGVWIDGYKIFTHSLTLTFLILGLILGCINAWIWLVKEEKEIRKDDDNEE